MARLTRKQREAEAEDKAIAQVAHILFLGVKAIIAILIMGLVWFVW